MIRVMENIDLAQCGMIYAKAFPMEHWGIDWTAENATEYLRDFFEQKRFVGYVYEENDEVLGCIFALCKISGFFTRKTGVMLQTSLRFSYSTFSFKITLSIHTICRSLQFAPAIGGCGQFSILSKQSTETYFTPFSSCTVPKNVPR